MADIEHPDRPRERESEFLTWLRLGAPQVYRGALQAAALHQATAPVDGSREKWRSVGPRNVGGAVRSLVQDPRTPTTLYAGTAQGGIWKTQNDGYFWEPIGPSTLLVPVAALAVAPSNSQVVYAGTGDFPYGSIGGRGIWVTRDGGDTFQQIVTAPPTGAPAPSGAANQYGRIVVDPLDDQRFWAASDMGLWRFDPGGAVTLEGPAAMANPVGDVVLYRDPANARQYILVAGVNGQGIFRGVYNRDTGNTAWTARTAAPLMPPGQFGRIRLALSTPIVGMPVPWVYAVLEDQGIVVGAASTAFPTGLFRSTDGGRNWAGPTGPQPAAPDANGGQAWYSMCLAVDPTNRNRVLVGYVDLHVTTNGGGAWTTILDSRYYDNGDHAQHADQHNLLFDSRSSRRVWTVNDGGITTTDDVRTLVGPPPQGPGWPGPAGQAHCAWRKKSYGVLGAQFTDLTSHPTYPGVVGGGMQDNGTFVSYGGPTWYPVDGADGGQLAFQTGASQRMWATWQGGMDRVDIQAPPVGPPPQYATVLPDRAPPGNVMFPNFTVINFPAPNGALWIGVVASDPSNANQLLIGRQGGAFFSFNGVASRRMNLPAIGGDASAVCIVPAAPREYWVGTTTGQLYHRAGTPPNAAAQPAWTNVSIPGVPGPPISAIKAHPTNPAVVAVSTMGNPGQVFVTHNRGVDPAPANPATVAWRNVTAGLPPGPIISLAFHPTNPQVLFAGTLAGVYVCRNLPAPDATLSPGAAAPAWATYNRGIPAVQVNDLHVCPVRGTLRAGTYARGAFESNITGATAPAFQIPPVRLSVRVHVADDSYAYAAANALPDDPRLPAGTALPQTQAFDIRIDAPSFYRSEAFRFGDPIDGAEFDEQLVPDRALVGDTNHVYVQVHNRGHDRADNVRVHLYWAPTDAAGNAPDVNQAALAFPGDPTPGSAWQRADDPEDLGFLPPGEPAVVRFSWQPPVEIEHQVALLAAVSNAADELATIPSGPVAAFVGNERRAALRVSPIDRDAVFLRDGVDGDGRLGAVAWGGRSPDIIVRRAADVPGAFDPDATFTDLGDAHREDRVHTGDHRVFVRVHNRTAAPIAVDVRLMQIPMTAPFPGTGWTQIGADVRVNAVPARGWRFATLPWNGVADPGGGDGRGFVLMALAQVVDTASGRVVDPFPQPVDVTDVETFWEFFTRAPVASNAALRAVRFQP